MKNAILTAALLLFSSNVFAVPKKLECLASVIWHESRGEPLIGQVAVGHVVLNRKNHHRYPDKICEVAFQKAQFTDLKKIKYDDKSLLVAKQILANKLHSPFWRATHYHTTAVNPKWANWKGLIKLGKIGNHIFYRLREAPNTTKLVSLDKIIKPKTINIRYTLMDQLYAFV